MAIIAVKKKGKTREKNSFNCGIFGRFKQKGRTREKPGNKNPESHGCISY
jgi:hypothetical protein